MLTVELQLPRRLGMLCVLTVFSVGVERLGFLHWKAHECYVVQAKGCRTHP